MSAPKPRLLLHVCCGPCAIHPATSMLGDWDIVAYYYNPNIHPQDEYVRRLATAKRFCEDEQVRLLAGPYNPDQYFRAVGEQDGKPERCIRCYQLRLSATATTAAELGFDAFTTTLLVSPYQDREAIVAAGRQLSAEKGPEFVERDFRDGFRDAQRQSRERGMYRQNYCGCQYSKTEAAQDRTKR